MRNVGSNGKKTATHRIGFYWPDGAPFVALPIQLIESEAFRSLPPKGVTILIAMLRRYFDVSKKDKRDLRGTGFVFTWKHIDAIVAEATFQKMVHELIARGFIETPHELQPDTPGAAIRYAPSRKWQAWRDSTGKLESHHRSKERRRAKKKATLNEESRS